MSEWSIQRIALAKPPRPNMICTVPARYFWHPWLLAVGMHGDELSVWIRNSDHPISGVSRFFIGCTGGICPPLGDGDPIGTVIDGENRWHVFLMHEQSTWTP